MDMENLPKITVVMPVYNSKEHLKTAIESIIKQTFTDWEMLVINEFGSDDGSADIVKKYSEMDSRIILVQNEIKLGLAESLNKGIRMARGKYIARMDADDISHETRFEKQVRLLDTNSDIGLCGTYQHHFGPHTDWVHKPPITPEECRANLIFDCDLCHSTVMFRKKEFADNNLFYDPAYQAEDFELWTRAIRCIKFTNIPEILGEYRWDSNNISVGKKSALAKENAEIVADALKINLGIIVPKEKYILLEGWGNPFFSEKNKKIRKRMYQDFKELLTEIYEENLKVKFYDNDALLSILASEWRFMRYMEPKNERRNVASLNEIFNPYYIPDFVLMWKRYTKGKSLIEIISKGIRYIKRS